MSGPTAARWSIPKNVRGIRKKQSRHGNQRWPPDAELPRRCPCQVGQVERMALGARHSRDPRHRDAPQSKLGHIFVAIFELVPNKTIEAMHAMKGYASLVLSS